MPACTITMKFSISTWWSSTKWSAANLSLKMSHNKVRRENFKPLLLNYHLNTSSKQYLHRKNNEKATKTERVKRSAVFDRTCNRIYISMFSNYTNKQILVENRCGFIFKIIKGKMDDNYSSKLDRFLVFIASDSKRILIDACMRLPRTVSDSLGSMNASPAFKGLKSALKIFTAVADALQWIMESAGILHIIYYICTSTIIFPSVRQTFSYMPQACPELSVFVLN